MKMAHRFYRIIMSKIVVLIFMLFISIILAGIAVYSYGKWFSHERYWGGTIERVELRQGELIRGLLTSLSSKRELPKDEKKMADAFGALDGVMAVEVYEDGELYYTNYIERFRRDRRIESIELEKGWRVDVIAYEPPSWNYQFVRWLKNPTRWLERSFDFITIPFFSFLALCLLALFAVALTIKANYLQRDVLQTLRRFDDKEAP